MPKTTSAADQRMLDGCAARLLEINSSDATARLIECRRLLRITEADYGMGRRTRKYPSTIAFLRAAHRDAAAATGAAS